MLASTVTHKISFRHHALLWSVFFLICLGLGYAPLKRYDPRRTEGLTPDCEAYYQIVIGGPLPPPGDFAHRVLVPYVAKPFYWLARGRVGTWDPVLFGLLVANALFTATTASLLVSLSYQVLGSYAIALLAAMFYLVNFAVVNLNLVAHADSAEGCFLLAVAWTLFEGRCSLLPVWGILGALAKESFVPLSIAFALGWRVATVRRNGFRSSQVAWILAMVATSLATITVVMSSVSQYMPWSFVAFKYAVSGSRYLFLDGLLSSILDRNFWYVFIWLLPLGVWRLGRFPRPWVLGSIFASLAALFMGAYSDALGNTARPLFNVAGPILSVSVAVLFTSPPFPTDPPSLDSLSLPVSLPAQEEHSRYHF